MANPNSELLHYYCSRDMPLVRIFSGSALVECIIVEGNFINHEDVAFCNNINKNKELVIFILLQDMNIVKTGKK
jgi:hypothetical protein